MSPEQRLELMTHVSRLHTTMTVHYYEPRDWRESEITQSIVKIAEILGCKLVDDGPADSSRPTEADVDGHDLARRRAEGYLRAV